MPGSGAPAVPPAWPPVEERPPPSTAPAGVPPSRPAAAAAPPPPLAAEPPVPASPNAHEPCVFGHVHFGQCLPGGEPGFYVREHQLHDLRTIDDGVGRDAQVEALRIHACVGQLEVAAVDVHVALSHVVATRHIEEVHDRIVARLEARQNAAMPTAPACSAVGVHVYGPKNRALFAGAMLSPLGSAK